jgi:hypothetical protein
MNRFFYMLITIFGLIASSAEATTVFQENFSGATPGTYGGAIPGSSFTVTGGVRCQSRRQLCGSDRESRVRSDSKHAN